MPREYLPRQQGLPYGGKTKGLAGVSPPLALCLLGPLSRTEVLSSLGHGDKFFSQPLSAPFPYTKLLCSVFPKYWQTKPSSTQLPELETAASIPWTTSYTKSSGSQTIPVFHLFSFLHSHQHCWDQQFSARINWTGFSKH